MSRKVVSVSVRAMGETDGLPMGVRVTLIAAKVLHAMNVALDLELWTETAEAPPEGITDIPKRKITVIATRLALASWKRGVDLDVIAHEPRRPPPGRGSVWDESMKKALEGGHGGS